MTADEFIATVVAAVHTSGIRGELEQLAHPSGRRPPPAAVALAGWYTALPAADRDRVAQVVRRSVHAGIFGLLAVLDGVCRIDEADGRLELTYVAPDGTRTVLNPPTGESLHDRYQAVVYESVFGPSAA
jgi:hypothetical protein